MVAICQILCYELVLISIKCSASTVILKIHSSIKIEPPDRFAIICTTFGKAFVFRTCITIVVFHLIIYFVGFRHCVWDTRHATISELEAAVREWFRHTGDRFRLGTKRMESFKQKYIGIFLLSVRRFCVFNYCNCIYILKINAKLIVIGFKSLMVKFFKYV